MDVCFDRLLSILLLEDPPDRIPFYDLFADLEVIEALTGCKLSLVRDLTIGRIKRILDDGCEDRLRLDYEVIFRFYYTLGYDYIPLTLPSPFPRFNVKPCRDTAALSRGLRIWQDEYRGTIESREDFERYDWPIESDIQDSYIALYRILEKILPEGMMVIPLTPGGVLENVMWLMGTVPFSKAIYTDITLVRDMFDKIGRILSFICRLMSEQSMVGAISMGDDMGYKSGPMISPSHLRRYVFPWHKLCVDEAHRSGKPFILHSCGRIDIVMEDLIDYVGIDAKHSYEDSSYPVTKYKKLYGDRIAILGGIDMDKLSRMPLEDFKSYVKSIIDECAPGGGYAIGCGNTIANYVKIENYLAMLEIGRSYGRYNRLRY
ncbi:uroporphyrinogen-III decarboxylase-like protein [Candidatus Bathyarchaeota archaeon]|nr:uroporphyrinogen-III decarboxylase-like protein [Candidatus Bathyarchaeota archaeon]